jgi:hypothetical protein
MRQDHRLHGGLARVMGTVRVKVRVRARERARDRARVS